jgi:hypothetical protein
MNSGIGTGISSTKYVMVIPSLILQSLIHENRIHHIKVKLTQQDRFTPYTLTLIY